MAKLSVLVTYHDEKDLLTECLKSVLSQNSGPDEVLIYDDASTFPATDYLVDDPRIRIVRGEANEGPSFGRNQLLKEAKGDYIHFHDADDWFHPDWGKRVRDAISSRSADAVFTEISSFLPNGNLQFMKVLNLVGISDHESLIRYCIRKFMLVPAGTFRTEFVRANGGYRPDLWQSEDYEFNIRMALNLDTFEIIPEPLVSIRLREESRSRNRIETNTCALEAIMLLKSEVPHPYWKDLAEKSAEIGRQLYQLNEPTRARQAFKVARSLGPPKFENEGRLYRSIARLAGQEMAERAGAIYRERFPTALRKRFR